MLKLALKKPIIQAPMAGVSTVKLAAEVTNSGGLGSLPMSSINLKTNWDGFIKQINEYNDLLIKDENDKLLVNLNFFCHEIFDQPTNEEISNWCNLYTSTLSTPINNKISDFKNGNVSFKEWELNENQNVLNNLFNFWNEHKFLIPEIVSFHFGYPKIETIKKMQKLKIKIFVTATSLDEAKVLIGLGIDGLILQGVEAGGHRGDFLPNNTNMSTFQLFNVVKSYWELNKINDLCIVPAGGIMDSIDVANYIKLGASAVQLGSVFLATSNSIAKPYFDKLFSETTDFPKTVMTPLVSGKSARTVKTPFISKLIQSYENSKLVDLPPYGYRYKAYKDMKKSLQSKIEMDIGFHLAGSNYHKMKIDATVEDIIEQLTKDL